MIVQRVPAGKLGILRKPVSLSLDFIELVERGAGKFGKFPSGWRRAAQLRTRMRRGRRIGA